MKKITDALMKTALTMGISLLVGIIWFCIIRFLDPEWALATIFMLCSVFIFSLYYKKQLDMDKKLYNLAVGMFVVVLTLYIVAGLIKLYVMFK